MAYLEENKLDEAEKEFLKLIDLAPDEALGYANLGLVYLRKADYEKAEKYLKEAIDVEDKDPGTRLILAKVYEFTDREEQALEVLEENLKLDPENLKTLYSLAEYYAKKQDETGKTKHEAYLRQLVDMSPENIVPRLQLTETLIDEGKSDAALAQLEEIPRLYPDFPEEAKSFYENAVSLLRTGKSAEAQTPMRIFHNFFKVSSIYQSGIQELKGPGGELVGIPLITMGDAINTFIQEGESVLESIRFTDVTETVGLDVAAGVTGKALMVADMDNDGDFDLYVGGTAGTGNAQGQYLFKNDMGSFSDVTETAGIQHPGTDLGGLFADYDNDGKLDLFVLNTASNTMFGNNGEVSFTNKTSTVGIDMGAGGNHVLFFDYDHEGDLDILLLGGQGDRLYRNNGDGTFANATEKAGLRSDMVNSTDANFGDFDDDGDIDVLVANQQGNILYDNLRQGRFQEKTEAAGLRTSIPAMILDAGDYNNDGYLDLVLAGAERGQFQLFKNVGDGTFELDQQILFADNTLAGMLANDMRFLDFDNDGALDILIAGEGEDQGMMLLHNDGWGQFENKSEMVKTGYKHILKTAITDFNEDGDLDIFFTPADGGVRLLRNDGGNANRYLKVQLVGIRSGSGKNNHFGIGAKVEVRAGSLYQMKVVTDPFVHFGLADRPQADVVRILWTNGVPQNIFTPRSDQDLIEEQELKGSCPFLYAWNGKEYVFVKDMMWRSALGMPLGIMGGNTSYAFADISREYLKIPGEMLKPDKGLYKMQITEELWEAIYFDKIKLFAVDHPEEVEIYVDEKFTPPPFPGMVIYEVTKKRIPSSAVNENGEDVRSFIEEEDDSYISDLNKTSFQGIIEKKELVLNLDKLEEFNGHPYLFLNGWIFPTDASINVNISQSDSRQVIAPYMQVKDGNGHWVTVSNIGFPMGKDKTMVVDLNGIFLSDDRHVKIVTNMEIYWDHIFYAEAALHETIETNQVQMRSADFHYRGYSAMYRKEGRYGPHWFNYNDVEKGQKWRDLTGFYTRYGDVMELLDEGDDKYIIANAGDEITLTFNATDLPTLPAGWKRDFLIYSEGWVKDGDLNTAHGQTVEPLPYRNMKVYPYNEGGGYPDNGEHRAYREKYNTRKITTEDFQQSIRNN